MKIEGLSRVSDDEREAIKTALEQAGYSQEDFTATFSGGHSIEMDVGGPKAVGEFTQFNVRYDPTGVQRIYSVDQSSRWIRDFIADLQRGTFKTER